MTDCLIKTCWSSVNLSINLKNHVYAMIKIIILPKSPTHVVAPDYPSLLCRFLDLKKKKNFNFPVIHSTRASSLFLGSFSVKRLKIMWEAYCWSSRSRLLDLIFVIDYQMIVTISYTINCTERDWCVFIHSTSTFFFHWIIQFSSNLMICVSKNEYFAQFDYILIKQHWHETSSALFKNINTTYIKWWILVK